MEKVIYALWKPGRLDRAEFNQKLLNDIGPKLGEHARAVRINIQDETVLSGTSPRAVATQPQMEAMVQVWLDTSLARVRKPVDDLIGTACERFEAWLVVEASPIVNTTHKVPLGERTPGFSQMVFLQVPDGMVHADWQHVWQTLHTDPAIDTQSNFEYHQNLVIRALTETSLPAAGIVEECFPEAALTDPLTYFDAPGDPDKMQANLKIMMDSVARFIDHAKMDCIPTAQYDLKKP